MKRIYWLLPCIGLTAFAGYYHQWDQQQGLADERPADPFAQYAYRDGRKEAATDLARGTPKILT